MSRGKYRKQRQYSLMSRNIAKMSKIKLSLCIRKNLFSIVIAIIIIFAVAIIIIITIIVVVITVVIIFLPV